MSKRTKLNEDEAAFIYSQRVARLGTVGEQDSPHLVPVCYACDGIRFYTPLDEKPKRVSVTHLQRVRNIMANHKASLLIDRYDDDWSKLGYILIRGYAELIFAEHEAHAHAVNLLRMRYHQYRTMALETLPIIMITPDHITAWGPALTQAPGD